MAGYIGTQAVSVNTTSATISDDLAVGDDLTVTDDAAIGGTLAVTGVLTTTAEVVLNGGAQINAAVNVGVNDQGYDFKFFGDTASKYMRWDASSNSLIFTDDSKIQMGNSSDFLIYHDPNVNIIHAATSNQDIEFRGNDNGDAITVLTLDMSAGGRALFNNASSDQMAIFTNTANDSIVQISATAANKNSIIHFGDNDDANVGNIDYDHNINDMIINVNASECARFISEGGITFNGDTAAANALNDYEEGVYTATITPSSSGSIGLSSGFGSYTKIGNLVTVNASCSTNAISSPVGFFKLSLPFTCNNTNQNGRAAASIYIDGLASGNKTSEFIGLSIENTTECRVYLGDSNLNQSDSAQRIDASSYILISVTYRTT